MKLIVECKQKYSNMPVQVRASLWFTICNVLNKGIALLATPIFTRIMTVEEYGQFTVYQSWIALLFIFTSLNIFFGGFEKGIIEFHDDLDRLTSSLYGLTIVITLFFLVVYLAFKDQWTKFTQMTPVMMAAMFLYFFTMPAYDLWVTRKRFAYEFKPVVAASLFLSISSVLLGAIWVMNTENRLLARIYSNAIITLLLAGFMGMLVLWKGKCFYNRKYWGYALRFNIPLIPHFLSTMILNQADRIMIQNLVGSAEAGMYGVAHSIGMLVMLIVTGVNNSFTPYCYQSMYSGDYHKIKKSATGIVLLMAVLTVLAMIFTPEIILIFAGRKYYEAIYVLPALSLSVFFIFVYSMFSTIEYYFKRTGFISTASIICAGLNIILNHIFIKKYGYYAAGYTTLACYIFFMVTHLFFCYKVLCDEKIKIQSVFNLKVIVIVSVSLLLIMMLMVMTYDKIAIRYSFLVLICIGMYIKRKRIVEILQFKKS